MGSGLTVKVKLDDSEYMCKCSPAQEKKGEARQTVSGF